MGSNVFRLGHPVDTSEVDALPVPPKEWMAETRQVWLREKKSGPLFYRTLLEDDLVL